MLVFSNVTCAVNAQTDKRLSLGKVLGFRKKASKHVTAEPPVKYVYDTLKNGTVVVRSEKKTGQPCYPDTVRYVYPDQSVMTVVYKSESRYSDSAWFGKIIFPDSSYYEGVYRFNLFNYYGELALQFHLRGNDDKYGEMHYKNGDIVYSNRDVIKSEAVIPTVSALALPTRLNTYVKYVNNIPCSHFVVDDYDFFLPNYSRILDDGTMLSPKSMVKKIEDIMKKAEFHSNEKMQGYFWETHLYTSEHGCYLPSYNQEPFWKTGKYPSVIMNDNIELLHQCINTYNENKRKLKEQIASLPSNKYSGTYVASIIGPCNAEYQYKEIDGIRYKDGDINCTTGDINLNGTYKQGERNGNWTLKKGNEIMISGEYNNNRRTGKWIYNMSFQKSSNKAHKIKIKSEANFKDGILVDNIFYEKTEPINANLKKTTINGQFTAEGVIDGDWRMEEKIIVDNKEKLIRIFITSYDDGRVVSMEILDPNTGGWAKITKNGVEYKNIPEDNYDKVLLNSDYIRGLLYNDNNGVYEVINTNNSPACNVNQDISDDILELWLDSFWHMQNPNDNEFLCKYYSR